jgi:ribosomal protein L19E
MEENMIPKRVSYVNWETRLKSRPRNTWQDEVREDGRRVGGKGWMERVYNRQEWKKLLRAARNCCILHMPMK